MQAINSLQGNVVEGNCDDAVYVVATDEENNVAEPRRAKFMHAMCTSGNIVSREWVDVSAQMGSFIPSEPFCIPTLADALQCENLASAEGGLFAGYKFYLHPSVPAKNGNPKKDNLLTLFDITKGEKVDAVGIGKMVKKGDDLSKLIVIAEEGVVLPKNISEAIKQVAKELTCP